MSNPHVETTAREELSARRHLSRMRNPRIARLRAGRARFNKGWRYASSMAGTPFLYTPTRKVGP